MKINHLPRISAGIYLVVALTLIGSFVFEPADQIVLLGMISAPFDIPAFLVVAHAPWMSAVSQGVLIMFFGLVQYYFLGRLGSVIN